MQSTFHPELFTFKDLCRCALHFRKQTVTMHKKESNHNVHPFMFRFCSPLPFMSPTRDLSPRACKKGRRGHNRYLRWKSLPRCCQKSRKREPNNSTIANIFPTRPQVSLQRRYISLFGFFFSVTVTKLATLTLGTNRLCNFMDICRGM